MRRDPRQLSLQLVKFEEPEQDFPPGPNYLSRFRQAIAGEGIVDAEDVLAFESAIKAWLQEIKDEERRDGR